MADPFLSEIRIMSFSYAPQGWAMCNGQFLPINQNQALFSLLGTTYGGNGQTTFALPDLRGRAPLHFGSGHTLGERGGQEAHTLTVSELPQHIHFFNATNDAAQLDGPAGNLLAQPGASSIYGAATALNAMAPSSIGNTGGSQAHQNMQPFLTLTFCIALIGIFPSRN
jgi:microcystin-dependent protein